MTNLKKLTEEQRLVICRKYYIGGFFILPWVHVINFVWFWPYAHRPGADPLFRKYIFRGLFSAFFWTMAFFAWAMVFHFKRVSFGETGDNLSIIIPLGSN